MSKDKMKKGIWFDLSDTKTFVDNQEKYLQAIIDLGFSEVGIPIKTRYSRRNFEMLDHFIGSCKKQDREVVGWVVCLFDMNIDEKLYCEKSDGEVEELWVCPVKAGMHKDKYLVNYNNKKMTYIEYLKTIVQESCAYPFDEINFQLLSYPNINACWCEECQRIFEFKDNVFDIKNIDNLTKWVNLRAGTIESLLKTLVEPIPKSKRISVNMFPDFGSYGRIGQKIFLGLDLEKIKDYCDCIRISPDHLGRLDMRENIEEARAFLTYLSTHVLPAYLQFMGITTSREYQTLNDVMSEMELPYFIIVPEAETLLTWWREV